MRCERCGSDLVEVDNPMRREFRHRRGVVCSGRPAPEFKETAETLNVPDDVQVSVNVPKSATDRLAEALDCVEQALTAPWEPAFVFGTTGSEALQQVRAEIASLQARLDTAEGRVLIEQGEVTKRDKAIKSLERALDEQRWYGEQLQASLDSCSGNHLPVEEYPGNDEPEGVAQ